MSLHRVSCVRIATWNVNSIGARLPRLLDWLEQTAPEVAALQETKCADTAFPTKSWSASAIRRCTLVTAAGTAWPSWPRVD